MKELEFGNLACKNENDLTKHKYLERELFGADDPKR